MTSDVDLVLIMSLVSGVWSVICYALGFKVGRARGRIDEAQARAYRRVW